jgi:hypothetical protein
MTGQPSALTGVTPPPPLRLASDLLGVEVWDVRQLRVVVDGRPQPDPNARAFAIPGRGDDGPWTRYVLTRQLRSPRWLNVWALRWGRDPALPPLTSADGRRLLRLLHEHVESAQVSTTRITTS